MGFIAFLQTVFGFFVIKSAVPSRFRMLGSCLILTFIIFVALLFFYDTASAIKAKELVINCTVYNVYQKIKYLLVLLTVQFAGQFGDNRMQFGETLFIVSRLTFQSLLTFLNETQAFQLLKENNITMIREKKTITKKRKKVWIPVLSLVRVGACHALGYSAAL